MRNGFMPALLAAFAVFLAAAGASFAVLLVGATVAAQVPQTTSYQGVLKDDTGAIVPDDDYVITFKIYDIDTGGSPLWTEMQTVPVRAGIMNVVLGDLVPLGLDFDEPYWLGVTIGAGTELSPRTELTGAPYALNAQMVRGTENLFPSSGDAGIGTTDPDYPLHVVTDDIRGISLDGTAAGAWSLIRINAAGIASNPGIEYYKEGAMKALTYVGADHRGRHERRRDRHDRAGGEARCQWGRAGRHDGGRERRDDPVDRHGLRGVRRGHLAVADGERLGEPPARHGGADPEAQWRLLGR